MYIVTLHRLVAVNTLFSSTFVHLIESSSRAQRNYLSVGGASAVFSWLTPVYPCPRMLQDGRSTFPSPVTNIEGTGITASERRYGHHGLSTSCISSPNTIRCAYPPCVASRCQTTAPPLRRLIIALLGESQLFYSRPVGYKPRSRPSVSLIAGCF